MRIQKYGGWIWLRLRSPATWRSLRRFPLDTIKGVAGIYWNALKLKFKGAPFYTHPDKLDATDSAYQRGTEDLGLDVTEKPSAQQDNAFDSAGRVSSWRT